jgi:hypothetical protein
MTDLEWARAFVGCKIEGTGRRFNETVQVLVKKLAEAREETAANFKPLAAASAQRSVPEPPEKPVAELQVATD